MPRVITGEAKGIRLATPEGSKTRPTADRVKEALFSILSDRIYHAAVLDLYAGSGQLGIEALSRGARHAVFVDKDAEAVRCIRENLGKTGLAHHSQLLRGDVAAALSERDFQEPFDLVFMDPPYASALTELHAIAGILNRKSLLHPHGLVVLEHSAQDAPGDFVINLKLKRRCKYGTVMLSFYGRNDETDFTGETEGLHSK